MCQPLTGPECSARSGHENIKKYFYFVSSYPPLCESVSWDFIVKCLNKNHIQFFFFGEKYLIILLLFLIFPEIAIAMMASDERPVSMVMTCNDAVEMMFMDGSRVQLSPCGSCFIYDPPPSQAVSHPYHEQGPGPSHPLYTSTRTQQRTCFVTSRCRSKVKAALEFRNRFASCPFLCAATTQGESPLVRIFLGKSYGCLF